MTATYPIEFCGEPVGVVTVDDQHFRCVWEGCSFTRSYATDQGALQGAAKHLMDAHKVRLKIAERQHGSMVHQAKPIEKAQEITKDVVERDLFGRGRRPTHVAALLVALAMMGMTIAPPLKPEPKDPSR